MRLLLDSCVWGEAAEPLRSLGHDVFWAGTLEPDPGDEAILQRAREEKRILVTLDKDFGELIFRRGQAHAGMIRLVEVPSLEQAKVTHLLVSEHEKPLLQGAILTFKNKQVRIRLPLAES